METNLLDRMLQGYLTDGTLVTVTLQNRIRVTGRVKAFDSYIIVMDGPQKREILYRHAVSSVAPAALEEQKRQAAPAARPAARPPRTASAKPRPAPRQAPGTQPPSDSSINNSMKEGLLKWMQEQKAAK